MVVDLTVSFVYACRIAMRRGRELGMVTIYSEGETDLHCLLQFRHQPRAEILTWCSSSELRCSWVCDVSCA